MCAKMEQTRQVEEFSRERLMDDVRQYPCIYDKFDKDYQDKNAKNLAWSVIAAKYGITALEADKKYKTMRSSFTRYLKKKRSTLPGAKPPPVPIAFVNLDWLANHIDHKETAACMKYASTNGKPDAGYYDYLPESDDVYHTSYGEIMREESLESDEVIEEPSSSRPRENLKSETASSATIHVTKTKGNLRPDPLPTPLPHVSTSDCQSSQAPVPSPPIISTVQSTQTSQANGPKSITMYYNRPKESTNDTVLNLIPLESVQQPSMPTPPTPESSGKRRRAENDDEDELFCLSLVPTLKRLGPRNKTIAKMRFQKVLFDLEFPEDE